VRSRWRERSVPTLRTIAAALIHDAAGLPYSSTSTGGSLSRPCDTLAGDIGSLRLYAVSSTALHSASGLIDIGAWHRGGPGQCPNCTGDVAVFACPDTLRHAVSVPVFTFLNVPVAGRRFTSS